MANSTTSPTTKNGKLADRAKSGVAALALIAGIFGSVSLLEIKAEANKLAGDLSPIPVATETLQRQTSYTVPVSYTGSVEAAQRSTLSFQVSGMIDAILVDEGDSVKKGQALARLDTARRRATVAQWQAEITARKADLELAELTEKRQKDLVSEGYTSQQRFDELRLGTEAAAARLAAAIANLKTAKVDLKRSILKAPFDGVIAARRVDAGAVGQAGAAVLDLIETKDTRARIGLSPEIAKTMRPGQKVTLQSAGGALGASVLAIRPDIEPATRSQAVLFSLDTQASPVSYGDLVRLTVDRVIEETGYWIPATAVRSGKRGLWLVYLVTSEDSADPQGRKTDNQGRIRPEPVEILHSDGSRVFVRGNLPEGARLVTAGVQRVAPGQLVRLTDKNQPMAGR